MRYQVFYEKNAAEDIRFQKANNPKSYEKILKLVSELHDHPRTGTGHPEPLRGGGGIRWSRAINKKDRLEYDILDDVVIVTIVSARGHYGDK